MTEVKELKIVPRAGAGAPCFSYEEGMTVEEIRNIIEKLMTKKGYYDIKTVTDFSNGKISSSVQFSGKKGEILTKDYEYIIFHIRLSLPFVSRYYNRSEEAYIETFSWNGGWGKKIELKGSWKQVLKKIKACL